MLLIIYRTLIYDASKDKDAAAGSGDDDGDDDEDAGSSDDEEKTVFQWLAFCHSWQKEKVVLEWEQSCI